jgi:hypothetical protein
MSGDLLTAALAYAGQGLRVLPLHSVDHLGECTCGSASCTSPGKHPRTAHGVREASADPDVIAAWWARWPGANVGLATGPAAGEGLLGWWVLDLDRPKAGEIDGRDALEVLAEIHGGLPQGAVSLTGSGGLHLLFRWPEAGSAIRSRARVLRHDGAWASADTRGLGGYIVAPPSMHATGARYAWGEGQGLEALCAAPGWLEAAVRARDAAKVAAQATRAPGASGEAEDRSWEVGGDRASRYVAGALSKACERLEKLGAGQRHASLLREARTIGGWLHLVSQPDEEQATAALAEAAMRAGIGEKDARRTARDGVQHGMTEPRDLPPLPEGMRDSPRGSGGDGWEDWGSPDAPETLDPGEDTWDGLHDDDVPGVGLQDMSEEDPEVSGVEVMGRRRIVCTHRPFHEVVRDAQRALAGLRGPARLYLRDGRLVQVVVSEHGPAIREIGGAELTAALIDAADWIELRKPRAKEPTAGEAMLEEPAKALPSYLVTGLQGQRGEWLPLLSRVATAPYYDADGRLVVAEGYDAGSRGYLSGTLRRRQMQVDEALNVVDDWIGQFPFERQSDRAHALAFALCPLVRDMIGGPVPMTVFEAPAAGTGKSLLMQVLATAATGRPVEPTPMSSQEDERRKAMGSLLQEGRPVVLLDNVRGHLHDPALEGVLTAYPTWSDRRMGGQDRLRVPATAVWGLSGNNLTMNADLQRRTVSVRLNARTSTPETRTGWRHADLLRFTAERRDDLLSALLTLVQTWQLEGRPAGAATLGSYEAWSRVMGGILGACGVAGFLGDREHRTAEVDPETAEWQGLLQLWATDPSLRGRRGAGELATVCAERGLLLGVLGDGQHLSRSRRLGAALGRLRGRVWRLQVAAEGQPEVWAEHEVVAGGMTHGVTTYLLRPAAEAGGQILPFATR